MIVDRPSGSAFGTGQGAFDDAPDNPALAAVQYLHPGVSLEGLRLNGPPLAELIGPYSEPLSVLTGRVHVALAGLGFQRRSDGDAGVRVVLPGGFFLPGLS